MRTPNRLTGEYMSANAEGAFKSTKRRFPVRRIG